MSCLHGKEWETSLQGMRRMNVQWGLLGMAATLLLAVSRREAALGGDPAEYESSLEVIYDAQCRSYINGGSHSEPFVHWTPDNAWLVVDEVDVIRRITADGSGVQTLKNPNPFHTDPSIDPESDLGSSSTATTRMCLRQPHGSCTRPVKSRTTGHNESDSPPLIREWSSTTSFSP